MNTRKHYVDGITAKLELWNKDIDKMEAKLKEAGSDIKGDYKKNLSALKKKRDEAEQKIEEMQNTTDTVWDEMKDGFEHAWDAISKAFTSAKDKLFEK